MTLKKVSKSRHSHVVSVIFYFTQIFTLFAILVLISVFGQLFAKRFALCHQTVVGPVSPLCTDLSVTLVYCGQTVGQIKMKLGMQVGLGLDHIVLDGDPLP